jgi:hypothetical protein
MKHERSCSITALAGRKDASTFQSCEANEQSEILTDADGERIVLPGEVVAEPTVGIMCGRGAEVRDNEVIANVRGFVTRIGPLLSIPPMPSIYTPKPATLSSAVLPQSSSSAGRSESAARSSPTST